MEFKRDYTSEANMQWIDSMYESTENKDRIDKHSRDYEIIWGNQKQHILNYLQTRYPESWEQAPVINLQFGKKILRKIARAYRSGVKREIINTKTKKPNKKLNDLFEVIWTEIDDFNRDFDLIMTKLNEYHFNHRYAELFAFINEKTGTIRHKPLAQHLFMAIPNGDKTRADAIVFRQNAISTLDYEQHIDWELIEAERATEKEVQKVYTVWSEDQHFTFGKISLTFDDIENASKEPTQVYRYALIHHDATKTTKNPYQTMNFSQIRDTADGIFYPWGSEIGDMSVEVNLLLSDILMIASLQGFGQAVVYYSGENPPQITKTGPTKIVSIQNETGNSKFEFANPNPDLRGHLDIALAVVRLLLTTNDLTTDKVSGELSATNFASAIDRLIADSESVTNIEDQQKEYFSVEQTNFENDLALLRYLKETKKWPNSYPQISDSDLMANEHTLKIVFNNVKPLTTESEKADSIKKLEDNGLIFPYEKHIRFSDGELTKEEAIEREKMIQQARKERQDQFMQDQAGQVNNEVENAGIPIEGRRPNQNGEGRQGVGGNTQDNESVRKEIAGEPSNRPNKGKNTGRKEGSTPERTRV